MAARRTKRVNGDGTIYRRDYGYEAAITVNGQRRSARAKTRAEAEAALRRLRAQRDTGQLPRKADTTVAEFLGYWLGQQQHFLRYSTWRRYGEYVNGHAIPVIGSIPLVRLSALHLSDLYAKRLADGLSTRTVLHLHRVLHKALNDAEGWDLVDRNVARKASPPAVRQVDPLVLSPSEAGRFLAAARTHPFGALFVLGVTTGLRQGELLGLRWSDLDLKREHALTVHQSMQRRPQGRGVGDTKTEKSNRTVELLPVACELLLAHRREQSADQLACGPSWAEPDLVFTDERGEGLNPDRVRRRFRTFLTANGMPLIPFKNLRHTFATLHLETGTPDKVVSEAMGHTRTSTTNMYYQRVDRRHQREAAAKLDVLRQADEDLGPQTMHPS